MTAELEAARAGSINLVPASEVTSAIVGELDDWSELGWVIAECGCLAPIGREHAHPAPKRPKISREEKRERDLLIALCYPEHRQCLTEREREDFTEDGALYFDNRRYDVVVRLHRKGLVVTGGKVYPNVKPTPKGLEQAAAWVAAR